MSTSRISTPDAVTARHTAALLRAVQRGRPDPLAEQYAATLAALEGAPSSAAQRFLARVFVDLGEGALPVRPGVAALADAARREREELGTAAYEATLRGGPGGGFLLELWRDLVRQRVLTKVRAGILAGALAETCAHLAVLIVLGAEAERAGHESAAQALRAEVRRRDPGLLGPAPVDAAIVRAVLPDPPRGLTLSHHPSGHLQRAACGGATLTLAPEPGRGTFVARGVRGGYGHQTREEYRDGAAHGVFNSPWHDGSEYREALPWLAWVAQCLVSVAEAASAEKKSTPSKKRKRNSEQASPASKKRRPSER